LLCQSGTRHLASGRSQIRPNKRRLVASLSKQLASRPELEVLTIENAIAELNRQN